MHLLEHALLDSIKIVPFIFLIYLIIEYFEHTNNTWFSHKLMHSKKTGVLWGSLLGSIPQCGFSVIASDLFSKRAISLGTLIAIFVATSDEAVPIILAYPNMAHFTIGVIGVKIIIAVIFGFLIDLVAKPAPENLCSQTDRHEHFHGNCESCEGGVLKSAIRHTIKIFLFIFIANLIMSFAIHSVGEENLSKYLLKGSVFQPMIASLIGLIPNCSASVILTQSFCSGAISFGSLIAGLSSGAGVGVLVLLKHNRNLKQNLSIILVLYLIGAISGMLLQAIL